MTATGARHRRSRRQPPCARKQAGRHGRLRSGWRRRSLNHRCGRGRFGWSSDRWRGNRVRRPGNQLRLGLDHRDRIRPLFRLGLHFLLDRLGRGGQWLGRRNFRFGRLRRRLGSDQGHHDRRHGRRDFGAVMGQGKYKGCMKRNHNPERGRRNARSIDPGNDRHGDKTVQGLCGRRGSHRGSGISGHGGLRIGKRIVQGSGDPRHHRSSGETGGKSHP